MTNQIDSRTSLVGFILALCGALTAITVGCGSSPSSRFYVLSSPSGLAAEKVFTPVEPCFSILVGPVAIPEYLKRPQIVSRVSPNELKLAEFDRWAEPLDESFARVLAENISRFLCTKAIAIFPLRGSMPLDYRVKMVVIRFDGELGKDVSLIARWEIFSEEEKKLIASKLTTISEKAEGAGYEAFVAAQSKALEALSREIGEAIKTAQK